MIKRNRLVFLPKDISSLTSSHRRSEPFAKCGQLLDQLLPKIYVCQNLLAMLWEANLSSQFVPSQSTHPISISTPYNSLTCFSRANVPYFNVPLSPSPPTPKKKSTNETTGIPDHICHNFNGNVKGWVSKLRHSMQWCIKLPQLLHIFYSDQ